jgi:methionyl-tRNA formyltransferase
MVVVPVVVVVVVVVEMPHGSDVVVVMVVAVVAVVMVVLSSSGPADSDGTNRASSSGVSANSLSRARHSSPRRASVTLTPDLAREARPALAARSAAKIGSGERLIDYLLDVHDHSSNGRPAPPPMPTRTFPSSTTACQSTVPSAGYRRQHSCHRRCGTSWQWLLQLARVPLVRVVFAGSPAVALPSLRRLLDGPHDVIAVVTRPDAPAGRGRTSRPSAVGVLAREQGIEVLAPVTSRDPATRARLTELAPDAGAVVAYGGLLPDPVLATAARGWVNLHFSLLPRWRGAAPVQHTLMAGDAEAGATVFELVAELDAGPVWSFLRRPLSGDETTGSLLAELAESGAGLLADTLDEIAAGSRSPTPQPDVGVTRAPKVTVADAEVHWSQPSSVVERRVRGCTPAPGAWTTVRGSRVKLGPLRRPQPPVEVTPAPGRLVVERRRVLVGTGDDPVELGSVQGAGRRPMPAADWARGLHLDDGEAFT